MVYLPSHFTETREDVLLDHIDQHDFALLVTSGGGLIASQVPFLTEHRHEKLYLLGHLARPNPQAAELDGVEVMVIFPGPHAYISPGWYAAGPAVPTWNFIVAHLYGVPEILSGEDNLEVLGRLVDHFEERVARPHHLHRSEADSTFERSLSRGTVGFRLTPARITAKQKMSQNKSAETSTAVLGQLDGDGPYANSALAREMRLAQPEI